MDTDHRDAWSRFWVVTNTLATVVGACTGVSALVIAMIALLK